MSWLGSLFSGLKLDITKTLDDVITNKEERAEAERKIYETVGSMAMQSEQHLTDRHNADMNSDSWLSKNIRPLMLITIVLTYVVFSVLDDNIGSFNIRNEYVELLSDWGKSIMAFYFGGRTLEKVLSGGVISKVKDIVKRS